MSLRKFFLIAVLVTMVSLAYVHQQVELLRINYTINRNRGDLLVLLDRKSTLMYNVNALEAPLYLEQRLIGQNQARWEIPARWHTLGLAEAAR